MPSLLEKKVLVLEILRENTQLSMCIFEQEEHASTVRQYSQVTLSFKEIEKLSQDVHSALNSSHKHKEKNGDALADLKKSGQLLWDHLLTRPVKERLKSTDAEEVVLVLDEELVNLPWELLYDGKEFFCLKFSLGRLVKTRGYAATPNYRSAPGVLKMLVLANPTDDLGSAYLEGRYIKNQFDRRTNHVRIDFKSTNIDKLYVKKNLRDYDIVHFAGHCELNDAHPRLSGWVLSDGKFSVSDIAALSESQSLPQLIFSNACHSAVMKKKVLSRGSHEKAYSLAAAFLFAGVRHYIGSIWKIEDRASLDFARQFYASLFGGASVGMSVRSARQKVIAEHGDAPMLWAGYSLYGDPHFVLFKRREKPFSSTKFKKKPRPIQSMIMKSGVILGALCLTGLLLSALPTRNPATYLIYHKMQGLFAQGENKEALYLADTLISRDPDFLAAYPVKAEIYLRLGNRQDAIRTYFDYAYFAEKAKKERPLAEAYIGIGWANHLAGEYKKAAAFYEKAAVLSRKNQDRLNEALALRKQAVWHIDMEEYDRALELLIKSSEINRERTGGEEYRYNLACDYFDMGLVFANKDDYATAREFYRKSQRLFDSLKSKKDASDYYFNTGEMFLFEKQYRQALELYRKGLALDLAQKNSANLAVDYDMMGELYLEMNDLETAQLYFEKALAVCGLIRAIPESASVYYNLGLLNKQKRRFVEAREFLRRAQEIYLSMGLPAYERIREELAELGG